MKTLYYYITFHPRMLGHNSYLFNILILYVSIVAITKEKNGICVYVYV